MKYRLGILSTHPIQYYSPWYRGLAAQPELDLTVYYAHRPTPKDQASGGFNVEFEWDLPLLEGYRSEFLTNRASRPALSGFWGCHTPEIADVIRREQFDAFIVHGWYNRSYWQAMRSCWRTGTPLMVRGDSTLNMAKKLWRRALQWASHSCFVPRFSAYLVVGQRAREYYLHFGAQKERMTFVPHFVDNERFARSAESARADRTHLRRRWGLAPDAVVFLFAAKFLPKKRPLDFIHAVTTAARATPNIGGLMVGDGPLRMEIEALIKELPAPVRLTGFLNQTEMPAAYAAADVLVLPSEDETWGLVVNEAMACGLPCLVSDQVGCAPDLVLEGQTGFVFPCGALPIASEFMGKLARNGGLRETLSRAALERISLYSVEAAVAGTCEAVARVGRRRGESSA